jgi:hypothetical protein
MISPLIAPPPPSCPPLGLVSEPRRARVKGASSAHHEEVKGHMASSPSSPGSFGPGPRGRCQKAPDRQHIDLPHYGESRILAPHTVVAERNPADSISNCMLTRHRTNLSRIAFQTTTTHNANRVEASKLKQINRRGHRTPGRRLSVFRRRHNISYHTSIPHITLWLGTHDSHSHLNTFLTLFLQAVTLDPRRR